MRQKDWTFRDSKIRSFFCKDELQKLILKSLIFNRNFAKDAKIYFFLQFSMFSKFTSIAYARRYCILHHSTRSVSKYFKMGRHQCKFFASNGLLPGLRKASF